VYDSSNTKKLLTTYLRRLTNLSGNNRSLFLPRLTADQFIDLQELSFLNGENAFSIIQALIAEKQKLICPVLDARMEAANEASKKLKKLQRTDHFIFEERGSKDLHVGWPIVQGKFNDGTLVRCPLLFFPVVLKTRNNQWILEPREDAGITFNKSFLLAFAYYNDVKANEELLEETFEEIDRESTAFKTGIYQMLQKSGLEIHFNPDNYRDELTPFVNLKKEEYSEGLKNGELKLYPKAVLGIFPQAGSYLVPDYMHLLEKEEIQDLENFFQQRSTDSGNDTQANFLNKVKEEKVYNVFPQDVWQENAFKAAKLGHSLVVQGPPGTGKSQLIANLIGDAIASGKRVLVVSQKRAALDVVYNRLKSHQLTDYLALVHDFKNDRREIYQKLARQIERVDEYKSRNISLDSIQIERKFLQISHRIDQISEELESFKHAFFNTSECGTTIKQLYLQSDPAEEIINLKQEFQHFKFDTLTDFTRKLTSYAHYAINFKRPDYPWKDRKSFSKYSATDQPQIKKSIQEVTNFFSSLSESLIKHFGTRLDWEQYEALTECEAELKEIKSLLDHEDAYFYFQNMVAETDEETSALWLSNVEKNLMSCYAEDGPELHIPSAQLGSLQKALYRSMKARKSLFGLVRWELFSKDKYLIKRTLVLNDLESNKQGFKTLERRLDNRLNLEHTLSKLKAKLWLKRVPETLGKKEFIQWFADQHFAIEAKLNFNSIRGVKNIIDPTSLSLPDFISKIDILFKLIFDLPELKNTWLHYLTSSQINAITQQAGFAQKLTESLREDFDALCEFDLLTESFSKDERSIIEKLYDQEKSWNEYTLKNLFINSLSLAWIDHLETKSPELRMISSGKMTLLENELRDLLNEKHSISEEIILLRAREKVIDELSFNRLNNQVTYRDLLHQVKKKKKIWPIRKLVSEFSEEIFKLVPCWLASPESVSAIFPMTELFDLVIFDEASQCYAERGIPALYRGKQTVIAGDAMQLKPGDFYQSRWQEEDETHPDAEIDSLLELSGRYLLHVQLQGHYRSKSLELIDFSNRHFYSGNLQLLPDMKEMNVDEPCLLYEKIEGSWANNTNPEEAQHIASLVAGLLQENPTKEIGVVTFNAPQQYLVMDVLEKTLGTIPETIFVKNIENVQGDERDIIIFSVGYAPDKNGKVSAHFGSLNLAGGENRLNVAVSRAREKIIVVTSILPDQLHVDDTLHNGPKLLKSYLQFVLDVSKGQYVPFNRSSSTKKSVGKLKEEIKEWASGKWAEFQVEENRLPFYDLTVRLNNRTIGAILTDDTYYQQSLSAKADHALTPHLLELKHWPFLRVYSRNYWQDPDKFFNEISKFLNR
jgi:superfamily I DNA and/or RNA helicase